MSPTSPQRPFRASSSMSPPGPVRSTRVARAPHLKPAAYVPATCTAAALSRWARSLS